MVTVFKAHRGWFNIVGFDFEYMSTWGNRSPQTVSSRQFRASNMPLYPCEPGWPGAVNSLLEEVLSGILGRNYVEWANHADGTTSYAELSMLR